MSIRKMIIWAVSGVTVLVFSNAIAGDLTSTYVTIGDIEGPVTITECLDSSPGLGCKDFEYILIRADGTDVMTWPLAAECINPAYPVYVQDYIALAVSGKGSEDFHISYATLLAAKIRGEKVNLKASEECPYIEYRMENNGEVSNNHFAYFGEWGQVQLVTEIEVDSSN